MGRNSNFAYTDLESSDVLRLEIGGDTYEVAMFSGSWSLNQIPEAVCAVALGRNAWDPQQRAQANLTADGLTAMLPAKVYFHPRGAYRTPTDQEGIMDWPDKEVLIFDGYYAGYSYQKFGGTMGGKVYLVFNLKHWLADLDFTSSLSSISHPANPTVLTFPAIVEPLPDGSGGAGQKGVFLSELIGHNLLLSQIPRDLWGAIQSYLCGMASYSGFDPRARTPQLSTGLLKTNQRAQKALARIEGPGGQCGKGGPTIIGYQYGQAIPLKVGLSQAYQGIAQGLAHTHLADMVHMTTWQAMLGYFLPQFQLDVCPAIDRAIVAPSLPGYNGGVWRKIKVNEYEGVEQSADLGRPLRAVVVHGSIAMEWNAGMSEQARSGTPVICGVYASKAQVDGDGSIIYQPLPAWMANISMSGQSSEDPTGQRGGGTINAGTGGGKAPPTAPRDTHDTIRTIANKYARSLYVQQVLRGRSGLFSGKLRFDVAPGSHLQMEGSPEVFIGAEDALAGDQYGQAARVSIEINAEGRRASTSYTLVHMRNETENQDERLSISEHPLYGDSVPAGLPLVPELALPADADPDGT